MNTRIIPTVRLKPGMIAADDVYNFNDQLIIQKGTVLTEHIIIRLKYYSISFIKILLDKTGKPLENVPEEEKENVSEKSVRYREQIIATPEFQQFRDTFTKSTYQVSLELDHIVKDGGSVDPEQLLKPAEITFSQARNNFNLFDILHCMRDSDDISYIHSLNVALISTALGRWIGLSEEDKEVLMLAALLHDIGKLAIPSELINKPGSLTAGEYAVVRTHVMMGYNILKEQKNLDPRVKNVALMHHERCDGSGYPAGLTSNHIDDFAKIVAIADVYDAMSSKRRYRNKICPFAIVALFEEEGLQKYDPRYILPFLQGVVDTYLHNDVLLSNGAEGEVVLINKNVLSRPVVRVGDEYLDLSKRHDISIQVIL